MGFRDRFYTPTTAKAILSWRLAVGGGIGVATAVAGLPLGVAIALGAGVYVGMVAAAMPKPPKRAAIDPFTLSEPWRGLVQRAQASGRKLRATTRDAGDGPLATTLQSVAERLEVGLVEAWEIARRGDELDDAVRRLDPPALRKRLAAAEERAASEPSPDHDAAVASIERQLATADRLKQRSAETAAALQLTQTQLDELVARASEVKLGAIDTAAYRRDVDALVVELEGLHRAVEETRTA